MKSKPLAGLLRALFTNSIRGSRYVSYILTTDGTTNVCTCTHAYRGTRRCCKQKRTAVLLQADSIATGLHANLCTYSSPAVVYGSCLRRACIRVYLASTACHIVNTQTHSCDTHKFRKHDHPEYVLESTDCCTYDRYSSTRNTRINTVVQDS